VFLKVSLPFNAGTPSRILLQFGSNGLMLKAFSNPAEHAINFLSMLIPVTKTSLFTELHIAVSLSGQNIFSFS